MFVEKKSIQISSGIYKRKKMVIWDTPYMHKTQDDKSHFSLSIFSVSIVNPISAM